MNYLCLLEEPLLRKLVVCFQDNCIPRTVRVSYQGDKPLVDHDLEVG